MGRDYLLDVDMQLSAHTVMGNDLFGVNPRPLRPRTGHG